MIVIVDQRTGNEIARFKEYPDAAVYRRDVLRPGLRSRQKCPYAIRGVPA